MGPLARPSRLRGPDERSTVTATNGSRSVGLRPHAAASSREFGAARRRRRHLPLLLRRRPTSFRSLAARQLALHARRRSGSWPSPVALLMIGGHFDLSAGVQTGTAGLVTGIMTTYWGLNVWASLFVSLLADARASASSTASWSPGPGCRASSSRWARSSCSRAQPRRDQAGHQHRLGQQPRSGAGVPGAARTSSAARSASAAPTSRSPILWWIVFTVDRRRGILLKTRFGNWIFATGGERQRRARTSASRPTGPRSRCS